MMKRTVFALALMSAACNGSDAPRDAARSVLVPGPGTFGYDVRADGRLAYSAFVQGKAAVYVANADGSSPRRVSFGVWDQGPTWSPDGKFIAFGRDLGGQGDVFIVPADSGAERAVATSAGTEFPVDWLADGSGFVYGVATERGNEMWVYRLADSSRAKLFEVDGSATAFASPDGKLFAYTLNKSGNTTVWIWDIAQKQHRQLTTDGFETVSFGAFSPDSRTIVFQSQRTGTSDLWRADVATGAKTQLTQDIGDDFSPRWSPDGKRIVFSSTRGGQPDVWVLTNGDADAVRVTDDALGESAPRWTHTGDAIIAIVSLGHGHLYSFPIHGGQGKALTNGNWDVTGATASRDKTQIAYAGTKNGDQDVWIVPASGGDSRMIAGGPGFDGDMTWSPDGSHLAFTSFRSGNSDIWIVSAQGDNLRRLTDWPSEENSARWSPDGKTIAFSSSRESDGGDVWTMPAAGGTALRLTRLGTVAGDHRWSPDGRLLAMTAQLKASEVITISSTGGAIKSIFPGASFAPRWSPDGRSIAAAKCETGYCRIQVRSLDGAVLKTFSAGADVYEFGASWSEDGRRILVGFQDLRQDGGNRVELRSLENDDVKLISGPAGYTLGLTSFAAGDSAAIAVAAPNGTALQKIPLPVTTAR